MRLFLLNRKKSFALKSHKQNFNSWSVLKMNCTKPIYDVDFDSVLLNWEDVKSREAWNRSNTLSRITISKTGGLPKLSFNPFKCISVCCSYLEELGELLSNKAILPSSVIRALKMLSMAWTIKITEGYSFPSRSGSCSAVERYSNAYHCSRVLITNLKTQAKYAH